MMLYGSLTETTRLFRIKHERVVWSNAAGYRRKQIRAGLDNGDASP